MFIDLVPGHFPKCNTNISQVIVVLVTFVLNIMKSADVVLKFHFIGNIFIKDIHSVSLNFVSVYNT